MPDSPLTSPPGSSNPADSTRPGAGDGVDASETSVVDVAAASEPGEENWPREENWHCVAPESVTVERIAGWIFVAVLIVAGAVAIGMYVLIDHPPRFVSGLILGVYAVAAVGMIWSAHFLPAIAYRHTFYQLSEVGFEIRRGIVWRSRITVPHARVQHTDVAQGPLERYFDVGKLIVYTAGTHNASVELGGLSFQTACQLRDALIRRREASDGV